MRSLCSVEVNSVAGGTDCECDYYSRSYTNSKVWYFVTAIFPADTLEKCIEACCFDSEKVSGVALRFNGVERECSDILKNKSLLVTVLSTLAIGK